MKIKNNSMKSNPLLGITNLTINHQQALIVSNLIEYAYQLINHIILEKNHNKLMH